MKWNIYKHGVESVVEGGDVLGTEGERKSWNASKYFVSFWFLYFENFNYERFVGL